MMDKGECVKNVLDFHDSSSFLTSAINFPKVLLQSRKEYNVTYSYITHSITHIYTKNSYNTQFYHTLDTMGKYNCKWGVLYCIVYSLICDFSNKQITIFAY